MKSFFVAAVLSLAVAGPVVGADRAWMDKSLPAEKRAALLIKEMTLEEKISQIHMMDGGGHPRAVVGIERLGIPMFRITNGPAGAGPGDARPTQPATALPAAIGLAASWDPELAAAWGHVAGAEVKMRGEHLIEGPGLNITRVPQNGRNFEYFGEDPWLSGRIGIAEVKAIQAEGVIAEIKHYACNNQESNRKTVNEIVDERTLREIYLPAFEAVVKEANAGAVMAAYPAVNGHFCSENPHLLDDILRKDWGFTGFVQSDYTGTKNATPAAKAGLDLSMKADVYNQGIKDALAKGEVKEADIDQMLMRRYTKVFAFGMMDEVRTPVKIPAEKNGAISREIAQQCVVLLKNEKGILPLDAGKVKSVALIGPYAGAAHTGGGGSSAVEALYKVSPEAGLKQHVGNVNYVDGKDAAAAAAAAKGADVAIVMIGTKDSEGRDRQNLSLPNNQDALVAAVAAANPNTVVVLKTGGPVLMPWVGSVPGLVEAWYPGEEDGNVVADVLFGKVNPSGKLPMTFPVHEKDTPANTPEQWPGVGQDAKGVGGTATYSEKLLVGYRWYDQTGTKPLFPFGYGLSYTTFALSNISTATMAMAALPGETRMAVSVEVKNTGSRDGSEVVQVYVAAPAAAGEPPKQLKGFAKVALKAGETKQVEIALDPRAFSVWSVEKNQWVVFPGTHTVLVGTSSVELPLKATVNVK